MEDIVVFGNGGHARVVIDLVEKCKTLRITRIVTSDTETISQFLGYPCIRESEFLKKPTAMTGVIGIGDNFIRKKIVQICEKISGFQWATLVHPSVILARDVKIGKGSVVMAGSVLQIGVQIGDHCLVNTRSSLDHDVVMENFASTAPGVVTGGNVKIGSGSAVGIGAVIYQKVTIGANTVVGGGSLVMKDLPGSVVAFGSPCKDVRTRRAGEPYLD